MPGARRIRHPDYHFGWTRQMFQDWASGITGRLGYTVQFLAVVPKGEKLGAPAQMG